METQSLVEAYPPEEGAEATSPQSIKYQELIDRLSVLPRYQYMLVVTISIFWVLITYNAMIGSFVFMNPLFQCSDSSKNELDACASLGGCDVSNYFTAVAKNGLYCDKEDIRSTIQSIFALGLTIGMISLPISGDIFGRRKTIIFIFCVGIIALSLMILAIQKNIELLMILASMLTGVFGSGMTIFGFILTCDFCSVTLRQKSLLIYCSIWGLTQMSFYLIYFHMPEWDKYLLFTLLIPTAVVLIFLLYFKLESPAYSIFVKKDITVFQEILQKLAKYNRIPKNQLVQIRRLAQQIIGMISHKKKQQFLLKKTLKKIMQRKNLITCVCLIIPLISFNFFYYGMQGSMERTGFNFGFSMLLIGFNEFLAYLSASYLTRFLRRKIGCIVSIVLTCSVGLLFLLNSVKDDETIQTIIAVLARIGSVYAYCFILLMQSELLQVEIRSTAVAIIVSIGEISRIVVPYLINGLNNIGIHPIIVSSFLFLFLGTLPVLGLRQSYVPPSKKSNITGKDSSFLQGQQND